MELNAVIDKRRTSRERTDRDVDFEIIKRIIEAGRMTPCFIGTGRPKEDERILAQCEANPDRQIHMGAW